MSEEERVDWSSFAVTVYDNQQELLTQAMRLHNEGFAFHLDPTFSIGAIWRGLPEPLLRSDLFPSDKRPEVQRRDCRDLPYQDGDIGSLFFDPPFIAKNVARKNGHLGIIEKRFGGYATIPLLWQFYGDALEEFARVLTSGGLLCFKCQDTVSGGKQHLSHVYIINEARRLGYYAKDIMIYHKPHPIWSPNMKNQIHARKTHSYFLCFING